MPSIDVVSKVDAHELTNAVDQAKRELEKRFDFRGTNARLELEGCAVSQFASSEYQLDQLLEILRLRLAGARRTLTVKQGIEQAASMKLLAQLKESKLKVGAQINGDKLRVSGKKCDDLQLAMALLRKCDVELPLQFENFRD